MVGQRALAPFLPGCYARLAFSNVCFRAVEQHVVAQPGAGLAASVVATCRCPVVAQSRFKINIFGCVFHTVEQRVIAQSGARAWVPW